MKLLKQSRSGDCLLYSVAMLLEIMPGQLVEELTHNGQDVWWPELTHPYCIRGIHIQEIIDCFWRRGMVMMPIEAIPKICPRGLDGCEAKTIYTQADGYERLKDYMLGRRALITGESKNRVPHACAWNGFQVYDPNGYIYALEDFRIWEAWIIFRIESK